jgi:hypothetical protein
MDLFNAPSREVSCVRRERTNTPLQALVAMNDPQFVEAARHLAEGALLAAGENRHKAVDFIVQRVLCRPILEKERTVLLASNDAFLAHYKQKPDEAAALIAVAEAAWSRAETKHHLACLVARFAPASNAPGRQRWRRSTEAAAPCSA